MPKETAKFSLERTIFSKNLEKTVTHALEAPATGTIQKTAEVVKIEAKYFWVRLQEEGCHSCANSCTGKALRWFSPPALLPLRVAPEQPVQLGMLVQILVREEDFLPLVLQIYFWPLLVFMAMLALPWGDELGRFVLALGVLVLVWWRMPSWRLKKFYQSLRYRLPP